MKKESKNLGVRKACKFCKSVIARDINFNGEGSLIIMCTKCRKFIKLIFTTTMEVTVICLLLFITFWFLPIQTTTKADKIERENCKNFENQAEAQSRYNRFIDDPHYSKFVKRLDANNNGKACEHLK